MIAAVIPTRYRPPELDALLAVLAGDNVTTFVLESEEYGHKIYRMWNAGTDMAKAAGATAIAILNDDIAILPGTLPLLANCLDRCMVVYPDVNADWSLPAIAELQSTEGSWGAGGMTGFCFMFRADLRLAFDTSYHWWYGDDAFEQSARRKGHRVCRAVGVPVRHVGNGSASRDWERLSPLIEADRATWEARNAARPWRPEQVRTE